jgi:TatD DNase family protein
MLRGRSVRGQLHCYSEGPEELDAWRGLGLVPSFAGPVTYRANRALRDAARVADPLLLETDAPYLSPEGHRGGRNEPAFIAVTYAAIAAERGSDPPSLAAAVARTARELFGTRWEPSRP